MLPQPHSTALTALTGPDNNDTGTGTNRVVFENSNNGEEAKGKPQTWGPLVPALQRILDYKLLSLNFSDVATAVIYIVSGLLLSPSSPYSTYNPLYFMSLNSTASEPEFPPNIVKQLPIINAACDSYGLPDVVLNELPPPAAFYADENIAKNITAAIWYWFTANELVTIGAMFVTLCVYNIHKALCGKSEAQSTLPESYPFRALLKTSKSILAATIITISVISAMRAAGPEYLENLDEIETWLDSASPPNRTCHAHTQSYLIPDLYALFLEGNCSAQQLQYSIAPTIRPYAAAMLALMINTTNINFIYGVILLVTIGLEKISCVQEKFKWLSQSIRGKESEESDNSILTSCGYTFYNVMRISFPVIALACLYRLVFSSHPSQETQSCNTWSALINMPSCQGAIESTTGQDAYVAIASTMELNTNTSCFAVKNVEVMASNQSLFATNFQMGCIDSKPYISSMKIILTEVSYIYKTLFIGIPAALAIALAVAALTLCTSGYPLVIRMKKFIKKIATLATLTINLQTHPVLLPTIYLIALTINMKLALGLLVSQNANYSDAVAYLLNYMATVLVSLFQESADTLLSKQMLDIQSTSQLFTWAKSMIFIVAGFSPACLSILYLSTCCNEKKQLASADQYRGDRSSDPISPTYSPIAVREYKENDRPFVQLPENKLEENWQNQPRDTEDRCGIYAFFNRCRHLKPASTASTDAGCFA